MESGAWRVQAQKKMAEILKVEGALRESALYYGDALQGAQTDLACEIQFGLAEVYELQGESEKAASEFLKLSYLYPDNKNYAEKAKTRAAKLFRDLGRPEEATKILNVKKN